MIDFIYLDNNSTTPVDKRVVEEMLPFFTENYANPSSSHRFGLAVNQAIENARDSVANLINIQPGEIVFTSGATESINLAIKGVISSKAGSHHVITSQSEHPAVLETCRNLENHGHEVTYLPPDTEGLITKDEVARVLKPNTTLVSIMYANNETGVIQPIEEISKMCQENGILFLTDATQAVGKIDVNVSRLGVDLMALSAHKFYGPKGVGALYIKKGLKFEGLMYGGGHEKGFRSGTLNAPGIIGLGKACQLTSLEMEADYKRIQLLRDNLESELLKVKGSFINGNKVTRLPNTSNICFPGIEANALIAGLRKTVISNGSACSSTVIEASHVLKSMELSDEDAFSSVRISLGRFTKKNDIDIAVSEILEIVERLST